MRFWLSLLIYISFHRMSYNFVVSSSTVSRKYRRHTLKKQIIAWVILLKKLVYLLLHTVLCHERTGTAGTRPRRAWYWAIAGACRQTPRIWWWCHWKVIYKLYIHYTWAKMHLLDEIHDIYKDMTLWIDAVTLHSTIISSCLRLCRHRHTMLLIATPLYAYDLILFLMRVISAILMQKQPYIFDSQGAMALAQSSELKHVSYICYGLLSTQACWRYDRFADMTPHARTAIRFMTYRAGRHCHWFDVDELGVHASPTAIAMPRWWCRDIFSRPPCHFSIER